MWVNRRAGYCDNSIIMKILYLFLLMGVFFIYGGAAEWPSGTKMRKSVKASSVPEEYIVALEDSQRRAKDSSDFVSKASEVYALTVKEQISIGRRRFLSVRGNADDVTRMSGEPEVRFVEPNMIAHTMQTTDSDDATIAPLLQCTVQHTWDTSVRKNIWGLDRIDRHARFSDQNYYYGEDMADTGEGVDAYVFDSGILTTAQQFDGRAIWGYTAEDMDGDVDLNGHGTHVAGIIGGVTFGVAKKVSLISVKVLDKDGTGGIAGILNAFVWLLNRHNNNNRRKSVVNLSLGVEGGSDALDEGVQAVIDSGITVVVAAGNEYTEACDSSPARVRDAITVGATDQYDNAAVFTNYGSCVDVFAPGVDILSIHLDARVVEVDGTSQATPHVTGAVARYLSTHDNKPSPAAVHDWIDDMSIKGTITFSRHNKSPNKLLYVNCYNGTWVKSPSSTSRIVLNKLLLVIPVLLICSV